MRSFQQVLVFLFAAIFAFAYAQDATSYDETVYITSTVYRVNTVTLSTSPTASLVNSTSTISATHPVGTGYPSHSANGTTAIYPTGGSPSITSSPSPSTPVDFPGAASQLNVNALLAVLAAGVGYMAL
ncbi:hypothetical protein BU24DRAFT_467895 [Aaosphaeria arxii CBS 175.79]|uniref:Uncharacterized protein n=1 Tax=Aaosphaeria arxii CBS 175.79 TaxID=1450172 RepID=A0A6A5X9B0_9PLEO|nr:uncharacterized protein BU24DRAFT_467895 [Aaosphaeria arxii CBS 175.79]KAF2009531.1 hypothetical protein BU24DRAFT_467895 [Aaosphaeria arxii CBS 175.79]